MLNKKREVVLSLINGVNLSKLHLFLFVFLFGFLFSNCHKNASHDNSVDDIELEIMKNGAVYLEKGEYEEANNVYSQFIIKYPDHPYTDDASYRLAYLCVVADDRNPYFDYQKAVILFQNFIENYPNSRYINACENWLNLLKDVKINSEGSSVSSVKNRSDSLEINTLKNELKRIKAENTKLKNTLEELEKAIER